MYLKRRFYQIIVITTAVVQCRAEDGKQPVLNLVRKKEQNAVIYQGLSGSTYLQRFSEGLNLVRKKEQNTVMNHIRKRALKVATTNNFDKAFDVDDDSSCCLKRRSLLQIVIIRTILVTDGWDGAAYLFHLDGTEVAKLTPEGKEDSLDEFGFSVSMDEKVVVGNRDENYIQVFSRDGTYERTFTCDGAECSASIATFGNLIVTRGVEDSTNKLFIYTTEGERLKEVEVPLPVLNSYSSVVATAQDGKTFIYSNTSPEFPKVAEINQGGVAIAVSNDRLVIFDNLANNYDGGVYLFKTDGTLVTALDKQDSSSGSMFGQRVAITDDKVLVSAEWDDDGGEQSGSIFIYSAATGEFLEKVLAPDADDEDWFGSCVSASDSYYIVGAYSSDSYTGAAYLFRFSEE